MGRLTTRAIKAVIAAGRPTKKTDGATVGAGALTFVAVVAFGLMRGAAWAR